ncbi:hypothetical protein ANCCAN_04247, partial [Ancylostoma caninum]
MTEGLKHRPANFRNTSKSLIEVKSSCCANIRRFMMNGVQREALKTSSDSYQSVSPNKRIKGNHYGSDSEEQPTFFKKMFKRYKRRNPAPDLSQVIGRWFIFPASCICSSFMY